MIHVLQVLPTLHVCGGVENYLMNYYRHIDTSAVKFTFAVHAPADPVFATLIAERGDEVVVLPPFTIRNFPRIKREIDALFETHTFDIVHCHQANAAWFYFKSAKKHGVTHRVLHSHQAAAADKWTHKLRNYPLLAFGKRYTTDPAACSRLAGDWLWGKRAYQVVNNAVDPDAFLFDAHERDSVRREFEIPEDAFVVGHMGRFCPQKNQEYLLRIFGELLKREPKAHLLLVGGGEDLESCKKTAAEMGIAHHVSFPGVRTDTARMYAAMDVFVMPSLYEGLPVVGVEAQAAGLPLVLADTITEETRILDTTAFLPLSAGPAAWAERILTYRDHVRTDTRAEIAAAHFDIRRESAALVSFYRRLLENTPADKATAPADKENTPAEHTPTSEEKVPVSEKQDSTPEEKAPVSEEKTSVHADTEEK